MGGVGGEEGGGVGGGGGGGVGEVEGTQNSWISFECKHFHMAW